MKPSLFHLPENITSQARNAIRVIALFLVASLGVLGFLAFQATRTPSTQLWAIVIVVAVVDAFMFAGLLVARGDRHELGVWLTFGPWLILLVVIVTLVSGLGVVFMAVAISISTLVSGQTLPSRQATRLNIFGVAIAVIILLVDLFIPTARIAIPGFNIVAIVLVGALVLVFGYTVLRKIRDYSLNTKLITSYLVVAIVPLLIVSFINNRSTTQILTNSSDAVLQGVAAETAATLDTFISERINDVRVEAQKTIIGEYLALPSYERAGSAVETALNADLLSIARRDQTFITSVGLLDKYGRSVADTVTSEVGVDKSQRDYFIAARDTLLPYVSPAYISPDTGQLSIYFSAPVRDRNDNFIGVLHIRYNAAVLQSIASRSAEKSNLASVIIAVFDENHIRLADNTSPDLILKSVIPLPADTTAKLQAEGRLPPGKSGADIATNIPAMEDALNNLDRQPFFLAEFHESGVIGHEEGSAVRLQNMPWLVATGQTQSIFLAPITTQTRIGILIALLLAAAAAAIGFGVARLLAGPIVRLTQTAETIAGGDINIQARVESADEIGTLANTFNRMTAQLREFIGTLEQRVAARTKDLATVAEVGTATATILETDRLLQAVVDLTKERFNLYHSHIYLLDDAGENLVLAAGAGEPGRIMAAEKRSIPLSREQSLVARAAREQKGVTVNDVTQAPDFLPNPLLPDTRSELAVPMVTGGKVIGVFDVQSDQVGRFTDSDINIQTTLAAQVATSIQNVRSFEQSKAQAEMEFLVNTIGQKIQRTASVDEALQTAVREIGLALGASRVSANIGTSRQHDGDEASRN
jgi:putative methionine-R-sulfoxide reductase with GAF domain